LKTIFFNDQDLKKTQNELALPLMSYISASLGY